MNPEQLNQWEKAIEEHTASVKFILEDRVMLKKVFEEHLRQFFDYDKIEYDKEFRRVTLKWRYDHYPFIESSKISDLGMDFSILSLSDEDLGTGVHIIVYPFGVEESDN